MEWIKKHLAIAVVVVLAVVAGITALSILQYRIAVTNEGEMLQENIETRYKNAQVSLSACLDKGRVAAQVTEREFELIRGILVDTASARYTDANGEPSPAAASIGTGRAFSGLAENYPTIDQRSWQSLQSTVVGCRDAFAGAQEALFYQANQLDQWTLSDNLFNQGIKDNFPTDELDVVDTATSTTLYGQGALDYMTRVIMVEDAREAYETGELGEQDLFN